MTDDATLYSCEAIQVLKGLEPVRKRPGMYIGDTSDGSGLRHMLWELVDYVIEQHVAGYASELRVELGPDGWIIVRDDGVGIPTDVLPGARTTDDDARDRTDGPTAPGGARAQGRTDGPTAPGGARAQGRTDGPTAPGEVVDDDRPTTALEAIFLQLHCGRYANHYPHLQVAGGGFFGVGYPVVNALSEQLVVETTYDGVRWTQSFERGERGTRLRRLGQTTLRGTTIRYRPDPTIFGDVAIHHEVVRGRLQDLSWLHPHLRVWFQEQRLEGRGGIGGWARHLAGERGAIVESFSSAQSIGDTHVEIAFAWNHNGPPLVRSFVNEYPTLRGSHHDGMWLGFAEYARLVKSPAIKLTHVREGIGSGLVAVINVATPDPRWTGCSKEELKSPSVAKAVRAAVLACLNTDTWHTWRPRKFVDLRLHC